jgi:exopolysaccharide production protein ExoZ
VHHYNALYLTIAKFNRGTVPSLLTIGHLQILGAIGVPIFFVISGFVIGRQSIQPGLNGSLQFMAKRIARIVPLYWTLTLLLILLAGSTLNWSRDSLLRSLLFVEVSKNHAPIIGPGWSLEYEMFFYLVFALLVVSNLVGSKQAGMLTLTSIFGALVAINQITGETVFYKIGNPIVLEFCLGLLVASIFQKEKIAAFSSLYLALGIGAAALSTFSFIKAWWLIQVLWGVSGFFWFSVLSVLNGTDAPS